MPPGPATERRASRFRWVIRALLFFAITIYCVDRLVFGLLGPELNSIFHWSNSDYADIAFWFEVAYAVGLVSAGRILDWCGTRIGLGASLLGWSVASGMLINFGWQWAFVSTGAVGLLALTSQILQAQSARGETSGGFTVLFVIAGLAYLLVMVCLHVLAPRLEPIRPEQVDVVRP